MLFEVGLFLSLSQKSKIFDSVSAAASVGASASQRCPPDTRTLVRGSQRDLWIAGVLMIDSKNRGDRKNNLLSVINLHLSRSKV